MPKDTSRRPGIQDRAVATRKRLLEATVRSLVECGYAGTTTYEVCRRAKASRGTLLHHFSTRQELVVQAVEYVLEQNLENFQKTVAGLPPDKFSLTDLARALWDKHWTSDTFYAWLELAVASRTDHVLNKQVAIMETWWLSKFSQAFQGFFSREPDGLFEIFFLTLNALSVVNIYRDPSHVHRILEDLLAGVDFVDRFFIRFGARQNMQETAAPEQAPPAEAP